VLVDLFKSRQIFRKVNVMDFKLIPGDILVNVNGSNAPISVIKRWALGSEYNHCFLYLGKVRIIVDPRQNMTLRFPLLFESNGRGVVIQALSNRYGQEVVVMRLKPEYQGKIPRVLKEAVKLASDERARYDYTIISLHIIPKLILEKLHLPIPLRYNRDKLMICSEAVMESFIRAKLVDILPKRVVPLPGDFIDSPFLEKLWAGSLSEEIV